MRAGGEEKKPAVLLLHGFPGNELNLDLAQALRRTGIHVFTLHYSGSWGCEGSFSLSGCIEDALFGLNFLREPENVEKYHIDTDRIYVIGHSMGGFISLYLTAMAEGIAGTVALVPFHFGGMQKFILTQPPALQSAFDAAIANGTQWLNTEPEAMLREVMERREDYDLNHKAEILADKPIYIITGSKDEVADETLNGKSLYQAIAAFGKGNTSYTSLPSDHSFSDRRIQLIHLIADQLESWIS